MSTAPFLTPQAARAAITADLDAIDAAHARIRATSTDLVGNAFRTEVAERLETHTRLTQGLAYRLVGELADPPDADPHPARTTRGTGSRTLVDHLARRLRLTPTEIRRRIRIAAKIRPGRALSGAPIAPELPALADAVTHGHLGDAHITAILNALHQLPRAAAEHAPDVETILVDHARDHDHEFVETLGKTLAEQLNPDEFFDDRDRQIRRGITLGPQQPDGMSRVSGWATPELRSYLEALRAAHHAPDPQSEPESPPPTVTEPSDAAEPDSAPEPDGAPESDSPREPDGWPASDEPAEPPERDTRTNAQRLHDAIAWGLRAALSSGTLGTHRGIPLTVIATATLRDLNQALHAISDPSIPMPGPARTGGGSMLPMRDLIRMAADSIHYLSIFDDHTGRPLYLGRSHRIATLDQRIICHARDRGCTAPGCPRPGYDCEAMHTPDWHPHGATDADKLYFGCDHDHAVATAGNATTTVTHDGHLAWQHGTTPPRTNPLHHPDRLLREAATRDGPAPPDR